MAFVARKHNIGVPGEACSKGIGIIAPLLLSHSRLLEADFFDRFSLPAGINDRLRFTGNLAMSKS